MRDIYGPGIDDFTTNYIVLTPEQMDDDSVIETFERNPAFNRDKRVVDSVKKGASDNARRTPAPDPQPNSGNVINF